MPLCLMDTRHVAGLWVQMAWEALNYQKDIWHELVILAWMDCKDLSGIAPEVFGDV